MSDSVLQEGRLHRTEREAHRRRLRRRHRLRLAVAVVGLALIALLAFMATSGHDPGRGGTRVSATDVTTAGGATVTATGSPAAAANATAARTLTAGHGYHLTPGQTSLPVHFKRGLRSGLAFDVRSGRVLWEQDATRPLAIASLTKMMTGLVVVAHAQPADQVLITRDAVHFSGSGIGLLPKGKRVPVLPLLYGLMLPSGNDAAIALAEHVAGTQSRFVTMMNDTARAMGLGCSHFTSVSGIVDRGNYSCANDLAVLAHAVLRQSLLGRIVGTRSAILHFPIKGGKLYLYNNNPLLLMRYRGADGVKTGYTVAAGACLVAAARRGRRWYGVVLLHSTNPAAQAEKLLNAAFARG